ncbi:Gfo/Idh/MocA family oxidoreductase [bacterium]|nr:Gfo/Idh/MocA family oxidoreductase [bacterium]
MKTVRAGIIGSGMISSVHSRSLAQLTDVAITAQLSRDPLRQKQFCEQHKIPVACRTLDELVRREDVDVVVIGTPNARHVEQALAAIEAGKHVICEKPLAMTIAEADRIIEAATKAGVVVGYAEELCYLPKFVQAKQVADAGAIGDVFFVKQSEKHAGPYSPWFFSVEEAGGGILMDMGCHAIEYCRWTLGKPAVKSVYAECDLYVHKDVMKMDDHVIMTIEFAGGKKALIESSWTLQGGMESRAEIHGTQGVIYANLLHEGTGLRVYSARGHGDPGDDAFLSPGWSPLMWEDLWQNGYPQEMADFVRCIREGGTPTESAKDGRVVLEIMTAGYLSAATGQKIPFPFKDPGGYNAPVELWLRARE